LTSQCLPGPVPFPTKETESEDEPLVVVVSWYSERIFPLNVSFLFVEEKESQGDHLPQMEFQIDIALDSLGEASRRSLHGVIYSYLYFFYINFYAIKKEVFNNNGQDLAKIYHHLNSHPHNHDAGKDKDHPNHHSQSLPAPFPVPTKETESEDESSVDAVSFYFDPIVVLDLSSLFFEVLDSQYQEYPQMESSVLVVY
jgi:hypothetical protein